MCMPSFRAARWYWVASRSPAREGCWAIRTRMFCCTQSPMRSSEQRRWATSVNSFPTLTRRYRNADSRLLLQQVAKRVRDAGWRIENIDATVIAEQPRIAPHVAAMCQTIAASCDIAANAVSVKGKTSEKLGFTGRDEGIAALAVALLISD